MKIYLAGGVTVALIKNRKRKLCSKYKNWKRLFSYFYMNMIEGSEIITLKKEFNEKGKVTKHN